MNTKPFFLALAVATPILATAQGDPATVNRLLDEGKNRNKVMGTLKHLATKIGPRLTGSPQLQKAVDWTASEFKRYGLQNVHVEQWGEVPVGFSRGKRQSAKMVSPWKIDFQFTTSAWTPGTKGKQRGTAVMMPESMDEYQANKAKYDGAWIVMPQPQARGARGGGGGGGGGGQQGLTEVEKAIQGHKILGRISGSNNERVTTGGRFTGLTPETLPTETHVRVRKSDYDSIVTGIKAGRDVVLECDIENIFITKPMPQYNVIADIPGTEKSDEIVIVCGHLDSWNGPGSQGTCDNGTGTSVTLEAARLLMASGAKPKRTIRFILWTGEEQGLLGSRAYVQKHPELHDKISAVFNDDGGTNYQGGYVCLENMAPMLRAAMAPTQQAFPELPMDLQIVKEMPRGGSSDHAPFNMQGIPGFFTIEKGRADYGYVWHTQNDKYEEAIPEYLMQSSTNAAVVAYNIACADTMLPRGPKPTATTPGQGGGRGGEVAGGRRNYYHDHSHDDGHDHDDDFLDFHIDRLLRWMGMYGK